MERVFLSEAFVADETRVSTSPVLPLLSGLEDLGVDE